MNAEPYLCSWLNGWSFRPFQLVRQRIKALLKAHDASSTYHSWSANGRWIAFASKRGDGMFARIWFAHIDAEGNVSKPFCLPQRDPEHDRLFLRSYNIPDLGNTPVPFDVRDVRRIRERLAAEPFTSENQ